MVGGNCLLCLSNTYATRSPWLPNQQDNTTREGAENNPKFMEQQSRDCSLMPRKLSRLECSFPILRMRSMISRLSKFIDCIISHSSDALTQNSVLWFAISHIMSIFIYIILWNEMDHLSLRSQHDSPLAITSQRSTLRYHFWTLGWINPSNNIIVI